MIGTSLALLAALTGAVIAEPLNQPNAAKNAPENFLPYRVVINGQSGTMAWDQKGLTLTDPGAGEIGFMRRFPVKPGEYLRFAVDAAAVPGKDSPFLLQVNFRKPAPIRKAVALNHLTDAFQTYGITLQVPPGTEQAEFYLYSSKPGTGAVRVRNFTFARQDKPFPVPPAAVSRIVRLEAENALLNPATTEIVKLASGPAVALKPGVKSKVGTPDLAPDLTFKVIIPKAGLYMFRTMTSVNAAGARKMARTAAVLGGYNAGYQFNGMRPVTRVLFVPWGKPEGNQQTAGRFELPAGPAELKVRLPENCRLDYITIYPFIPPAVPKAVQNYKPSIVPPKGHPRVWVTAKKLAQVRRNLNHPEHKAAWEFVKKNALKPVMFKADPVKEVAYDRILGEAMADKAFYYLMTGDKKVGRAAVDLTLAYFTRVEFGNKLDVFREVGLLLLQASYVYDWCFDLTTPAERGLIRKNMMRLAYDMECGWPPFLQDQVNGHGNETQVSRDLLAMAIAVYDEDPVPYQYCAWKILEQLVPMRKFEYASPRHNQGTSYGIFRHSCDMQAACQYLQMTGKKIFVPGTDDVLAFWTYMRRPDGGVLTDGDNNLASKRGTYFGNTVSAFLCSVYSHDPRYKAEFYRMGGAAFAERIQFLLLNDPEMKPDERLDDLPLVRDNGPVYGSMNMRTGWDMNPLSNDVVAETRGGGYHFGNHRHADAGEFQIYYRTMLVNHIGHYGFYGRPYDMNFNKRSVSRSMLLCIDPAEKFLNTEANDGGSRFVQKHPVTEQETRTDPEYNYGKKLSGSFGPGAVRPLYSYFAAQHAGAYSSKVKSFVRRFIFWNMENAEAPAVFIVSDCMTSRDPAFRKIWQLTSFADTVTDGRQEIAIHGKDAFDRDAYLSCSMLLPQSARITVTSKDATNNVFGHQYHNPPRVSITHIGHRAMVEPPKAQATDRFLAVLKVGESKSQLPAADFTESEKVLKVRTGNRITVLPADDGMTETAFTLAMPKTGKEYLILAAGLKPGNWCVELDGKAYTATVQNGKNTVFLVAKAGDSVKFRPGTGNTSLPDYCGRVPEMRTAYAANAVYDGKERIAGTPFEENRILYVPVENILKHYGATLRKQPGMLHAVLNGKTYTYYLESPVFTVNGRKLVLNAPALYREGAWYVPAEAMGGFFGKRLIADPVRHTVIYLPAPADRVPVAWTGSRYSPEKLRLLTDRDPARNEYWDAFGPGKDFTMALDRPAVLTGFKLRIYNGAVRTAKFKVETSADGEVWKTVYEGTTGKKAGDQLFTVKPEPAALVRFTGYGNSENPWNSIIRFEPVVNEQRSLRSGIFR